MSSNPILKLILQLQCIKMPREASVTRRLQGRHHDPDPLLATLRNISLMFLDPTSVFGFFAGLPLLDLAPPFAVLLCMVILQEIRGYMGTKISQVLSRGSPQRGGQVPDNCPHKTKLHQFWSSHQQ